MIMGFKKILKIRDMFNHMPVKHNVESGINAFCRSLCKKMLADIKTGSLCPGRRVLIGLKSHQVHSGNHFINLYQKFAG